MKKIMQLLIMVFFMNFLFAQINIDRNKITTTIESLNKEMEKVFNANDMVATAAFYSDRSCPFSDEHHHSYFQTAGNL